MAVTSQSYSLSSILTAIVNQLVSVTGIDAAYVHLVANDNYEINCLEPRFLFVRYFGLDPATNAGCGRRGRPLNRLVRVYVYTRNNLDQYTHDEISLQAVDGHEALELLTITALDEFYPKDDDGQVLTIEPLHPMNSVSNPPLRKAENEIGLTRSALDYQIVYLAPVPNPQP